MKRFALFACCAVFAAATATGTLAADIPRKGPVYQGFSWTGFYVGINGGYGWGKSDWNGATTTGSITPKGALIGGTLGYNMQTGVWVWGLEGDLALSTIKGTDSPSAGTGLCSGPTGCETRNTWLGTARGRIGYAWDRWLPFFTGGAAFGSVKMIPNIGTSETDTRIGWTLGGGVEYAFMGPWSAKLEYLYVDLGTSNCSVAACGTSTDVTFKTNIIRAGLNYRF